MQTITERPKTERITGFAMDHREQEAYARTLIEGGYVKRVELYEDPHSFALRTFKIPTAICPWFEALMIILMGPILHDDIEELVTNHKRVAFRNEIMQKNPDLYRFYERNKFQSSNVGWAIQCVLIIHDEIQLPDDIMYYLETLRGEFSGIKIKGNVTPVRYKCMLNNKEKYHLVKATEKLIEKVFLALIERESKY